MAKKRKKPKTGYETHDEIKLKRKKTASYLYTDGKHKITMTERIIKTVIFVVLRIVIKPSKWENPKKNYEVIDRAYKRIMSADMIFIPSSIAFYLMMAFMPILSIIFFSYSIPGFSGWAESNGGGPTKVAGIIGKFIPGSDAIFTQISNSVQGSDGTLKTGAVAITGVSIFISLWIAGGGFAKLVFTQSYLYEHKFVGGYWANKIKGMIMVILFTFLLLTILILNLFLQKVLEGSQLASHTQNIVLYIILISGLFFGIIIGFLILLKFSPRFKLKFREVLPGALVAGIPTALFIAVFGPLTSMWSYSTYGVAAAIMYIGMASLFVTNFIYIGLATNVAYYKTFVREYTIKKWTLSKK